MSDLNKVVGYLVALGYAGYSGALIGGYVGTLSPRLFQALALIGLSCAIQHNTRASD